MCPPSLGGECSEGKADDVDEREEGEVGAVARKGICSAWIGAASSTEETSIGGISSIG